MPPNLHRVFAPFNMCLAALGIALLACGFPVMPDPSELDALQQTKTSLCQTQTEMSATPTSPPTATGIPTTTPTKKLPNVTFEGISFSFDPVIADAAVGEIIPLQDKGEYGAIGDTYPNHIKVHFSGYTLAQAYHEPTLYVYPVAEYEAINEWVNGIFADLRSILENYPDLSENMEGLFVPFLPMWNAGQFFTVKPAYLDFQNGSGIRYLTMVGQDIYPVDNQRLLYTYQGLTADGKYYISFILPVAHPLLPYDAAASITDWEGFSANWDAYINETKAKLNELPLEQFSPPLHLLDQMVESLIVKP